MLTHFGADITSKGTTATVTPGKDLHAQEIIVPGDISSAAYFIAAALMVPDSEILIKNVGINPTRDGLLRVCQDMGADITPVSYTHLMPQKQEDSSVYTKSFQLSAYIGYAFYKFFHLMFSLTFLYH